MLFRSTVRLIQALKFWLTSSAFYFLQVEEKRHLHFAAGRYLEHKQLIRNGNNGNNGQSKSQQDFRTYKSWLLIINQSYRASPTSLDTYQFVLYSLFQVDANGNML